MPAGVAFWAGVALMAAACTPDFSAIDERTYCQQNTDCLPGRVCLQNTCIDPTNPPRAVERKEEGEVGGGQMAGDPGGVGDEAPRAEGTDEEPPNEGGDEGASEFDTGEGGGQEDCDGEGEGGDQGGDPGGQGEGGAGAAGEEAGEGGQAGNEVGEGDGEGGQEGGADGGAPTVGDVVISEIMVNPGGAQQVQDDDAEWIEIQNLTDRPFSLNGWALQDDGSPAPYAFPERSLLEARGIILIGRSSDLALNGGIHPDFVSGDAHRLANEADRIQLFGPAGELLDEVSWTTPAWPVHPGAAMSLNPDTLDPVSNDDPTNWCPSPAGIIHGGDRGSPGRANPPCPPVDPVYCRDAIDVSAGGLFGWDLALSEGGILSDHAFLGRCDSPGVEDPYTIGLGSPDTVFKFASQFDSRWRLDLQATRRDADLAMYVWSESCPRLSAEACADDTDDGNGGIDRSHAVIDRVFAGGRIYFIIVDGVTAADGAVSPQPFTLDVVRGGL